MSEQMNGMGHRQAAALREVATAMTAIARVCPREFAADLQTERKRLADWHTRVAVVGQVKAGKSTFLSALIGRPGFLPSEVNPWTSVITHMRFGLAGDPSSGGSFHFFDESAWQRIITGDADTRKLAEDMLPGFRADVLKSQTEDMRARAQKRLGGLYDTLLGTKHQYDVVNRQLLERYVCAGPGADEDLDDPVLGQYAAITRQADIYFPRGDFAVPTILTDTPGVNDPFLVRDEFTCRSLAESDIFVVMLSAHQALTEVDTALVRMLSMHSGKEIIIFVNRIDEIDDYATNAVRVRDDVTRRMQTAIPGRAITVIVGSAYWAELATAKPRDMAAIARIADSTGMTRYLAEMRDETAADATERLMIASGLPAVRKAIAGAIDAGIGPAFIAQITANTLRMTDSLRAIARTNAMTLREKMASTDVASVELVTRSLESAEARSRRIAQELSDHFTATQTQVQDALNTSWMALRRDLDLTAHGFLDTEAATLQARIATDGDARNHDFSILPLREALETRTVESYAAARARIDGIVHEAALRLSDLGEEFLPDAAGLFNSQDLPGEEIVPVFLSSARTLTIDLMRSSGWAFWRRAGVDEARSTAGLKRAVLSEIHPSTDNLITIFETGLIDRCAAAMERLSLLSRLCISAITDKVETLGREVGVLGEATNPADQRARLMAHLADDLRQAEAQAELYGEQDQRLRRVSEQVLQRGAA